MKPIRSNGSVYRQRGSVLPWVVGSLAVVIGFAALAVDVGHILTSHVQLQAITDAATMAGGSGLPLGLAEARARAIDYAGKNTVNGQPVTLNQSDIQFGNWDTATRTFTPVAGSVVADPPDAIRISTELSAQRGNSVSHFFARIFNADSSDIRTSSVAFFQARDIVLVLDLSGSMNDDSELRHIDRMGQLQVEANLHQIWTQLGAPVYGTMQFQPMFVPSDDLGSIKSALGLDGVVYPYPSGSWDDFIDYVRTDSAVFAAGYQKSYGYLTLVNYWLYSQPGADQTPDLWMTSQQPITAVKDAVSLFLGFVQQFDTDDRVGLTVYTSADGTALLESPLTDDFALIENITRQRQAAHYLSATNIGAGIQTARGHLETDGRDSAVKLMVLLTDGKANLPGNEIAATNFAEAQAQLAGHSGIPILTISLGADADVALMQQIADVSGGVHFNIGGGLSIPQVADQLNDTFRQIAHHRRVRLVH